MGLKNKLLLFTAAVAASCGAINPYKSSKFQNYERQTAQDHAEKLQYILKKHETSDLPLKAVSKSFVMFPEAWNENGTYYAGLDLSDSTYYVALTGTAHGSARVDKATKLGLSAMKVLPEAHQVAARSNIKPQPLKLHAVNDSVTFFRQDFGVRAFTKAGWANTADRTISWGIGAGRDKAYPASHESYEESAALIEMVTQFQQDKKTRKKRKEPGYKQS